MRDWIRSLLLVGVFGSIAAEIVGQTADQVAQENGALEMQPQSAYWSALGANETYCSELYRLLKNVTQPDPSLYVTHFPEIYRGVHFMEPLKDALIKLGLDDQLCPPASPIVSDGVPFYFRPFKLEAKARHETSIYGGDDFSHLYLLTDGRDRVVGVHLVCLTPTSRVKPNTDLFYFDFPLSKKRSSTITRVRWEIENKHDILILKAWHVHVRNGDRCLEFSEWYLPKRVASFIRYVLEIKLGLTERKTTEIQSDMVHVDGGTFSESSEYWSGTSVKSFFIARYETTWGDWQGIRIWALKNGYDIGNAAGSGDDHPVHSVTWSDILKWCNARSEKEGLSPVYYARGKVCRTGILAKEGENAVTFDPKANGYRLPTEAEWDWAERGGNLSKGYSYGGSNNLDEVAWWRGNSGGAVVDMYRGHGTWPVGRKKPNELGIYDMWGNVWEICFGAKKGSPFLLGRGGHWGETESVVLGRPALGEDYCAVADSPESWRGNWRGNTGGFRVVRSERP
jgi:sulfatase modifying factor 1